MKLRVKIVELLVQLELTMYQTYVTTGPNKEPILYVKLLKALYGLLRSALLFYKKLRGDLEKMGFDVNPYELCVANKTINGSQMTMTWHADDLKMSHKESEEVMKFIHELGQIYGNTLIVHRSKVYLYLGMDFDYSTSGISKNVLTP